MAKKHILMKIRFLAKKLSFVPMCLYVCCTQKRKKKEEEAIEEMASGLLHLREIIAWCLC